MIPSPDQVEDDDHPLPRNLEVERLVQKIADLENQLTQLYHRLPAHSLSPALLAEMDALDEQLALTRRHLAAVLNHSDAR